jgi:hypothetical protein
MTTKEKRFPLSLSSVVDQREAGRGDRSGRSASTQTATQNARQGANLAARISSVENGRKKHLNKLCRSPALWFLMASDVQWLQG